MRVAFKQIPVFLLILQSLDCNKYLTLKWRTDKKTQKTRQSLWCSKFLRSGSFCQTSSCCSSLHFSTPCSSSSWSQTFLIHTFKPKTNNSSCSSCSRTRSILKNMLRQRTHRYQGTHLTLWCFCSTITWFWWSRSTWATWCWKIIFNGHSLLATTGFRMSSTSQGLLSSF